jgi:hypothetical protein
MRLPSGTGTSIFAKPGESEPAISCSSLTACTAVSAVERPPFFFAVPAVWRLSGTNWTARALPSPPGTTTGNRIAILSAVSCSDAAQCVAVGYHEDSAHRMVPLIESYATGRWTATDGLISGPDSAYLEGIDCLASDACTGVGFAQESPTSPDQHPVVVRMRHGHWALQTLPLGRSVKSATFRSVSCPTVTACVAVGWSGTLAFKPYADRLVGGRSRNESPGDRIPFDIVSCPTASHCISTTGLDVPARDRVDTLVSGRWSNRSVGLPG